MKTRTIIVKGKPFTYEDEIQDICYDNISTITEDQARNLLIKTKEVFDAIGLDFYLAFGTLLGAIREKSLIKGDEDVDVFITDEQKLYDNLPYIYDHGLRLCRMHKRTIYSFRIGDNSYIDVYILSEIKNSLWSSSCYRLSAKYVPKSLFSEFEDIEFLGIKCKCPQEPEKVLEFWYGETWRTPVSGHNFKCEVPSAYYYHSFINYSKQFVKFLIGWKYWRQYVKSEE